ncbi:hypothetical protein DY000_02060989 [Brassica cretica]|uniref:Uncharacterized protein n=1 Tax=Brassica cretica TaxID=69181 RepID=A0ABQ7B095_BRACR|nr:hypothetical protein DY000_02060989 [Brassica cretica]
MTTPVSISHAGKCLCIWEKQGFGGLVFQNSCFLCKKPSVATDSESQSYNDDFLTGRGSLFGKDFGGQLSCSRVRRQAEGNCPSCHQMRYWVLGLVPRPGITLPGEVDCYVTGPME